MEESVTQCSKKRALCVATAVLATCIVATVVDSFEMDKRRLRRNKVRKMDIDFMCNNPIYDRHREPPQHPLVTRVRIEDLFSDENRNYIHVFTSLFGWEFFSLADYLRPWIETSRRDPNMPMGNRMKKDYRSRLYYTLYWLVTRSEYRMMEFYFGWAKSQFEKDIPHVLRAIIRGLQAFVQWPSAQERSAMGSTYSGIFAKCVGIIDANEVPIFKSADRVREAHTFSGKAGGNTKKHLAVIDRRGRFRFVHVDTDGGTNDRDQFTSTLLYTKKWEFFEDDEFIAADGIYRGDGNCLTSFTAAQLRDDPDASKGAFNLAFTEYRKGIENAFGRVQNWFPSLGNNTAKWSHNTNLLALAFHAACRLHNWMLHVRNLDYDPTTDPSYLYTAQW